MRTGIGILALGVLAAILALGGPTDSSPAKESYAVDPVHSVVLFRINHAKVATFYGRFNKIEGTFAVDEEGEGAVEITIAADSVDTNNEKRDGHLKSPDFFSVKEFPTITFKGALSGEEDAYEATGMLTLHGVSKEVTVELTRVGAGEALKAYRTGFEGTFTISRSDYGMKWGIPDLLGDEVEITVAIEGIRQ